MDFRHRENSGVHIRHAGGIVQCLAASIAIAAALIVCPGGIAFAQESPHGTLAFACEDCHSADSWKVMPVPAKFDHRRTRFALRGQHAEVACMDCHASLTFKFRKASAQCADCHKDVHNAELGQMCDRCHSPQTWLVPDMMQKHSATRFSLLGMHATVPCQQCHTNEQKHQYVGLRTDCFGCHQTEYDATTAPSHRASGLGTDCESCHAVNAMNWGGTFDHAKTGFPLLGAHASLACVQCHTGNAFKAAATQCMACHANDFASAKSPPHTGFSADCSTCHTMAAWQPASFDHSKSSFPLTGAHAAVTCQQCHLNSVFAGLSTACYSCHQSNFTTANAPPHAGFSTDCTACHTTNPGWAPSTYSHANATPHFPQDNRHMGAACALCHQNATNYTLCCCQSSGCHNSCQGGGG